MMANPPFLVTASDNNTFIVTYAASTLMLVIGWDAITCAV